MEREAEERRRGSGLSECGGGGGGWGGGGLGRRSRGGKRQTPPLTPSALLRLDEALLLVAHWLHLRVRRVARAAAELHGRPPAGASLQVHAGVKSVKSQKWREDKTANADKHTLMSLLQGKTVRCTTFVCTHPHDSTYTCKYTCACPFVYLDWNDLFQYIYVFIMQLTLATSISICLSLLTCFSCSARLVISR